MKRRRVKTRNRWKLRRWEGVSYKSYLDSKREGGGEGGMGRERVIRNT